VGEVSNEADPDDVEAMAGYIKSKQELKRE
jgi:hypothetical protein